MSYINCHYYNQELDKECHTFSQIPANRYGAGLMVPHFTDEKTEAQGHTANK